MLPQVSCKKDANWLMFALAALDCVGCVTIIDVLDDAFLEATRVAMYEVQQAIMQVVGEVRLKQAGELGILRLMMQFHPHFFKLLEIPEVLALVDHTVSETAILHLQNGFILPSFPTGLVPTVFQNQFHMDFRRVLNGYLMSINTIFAINAFTRENGGTLVVPGSHQKLTPPNADYLQAHAIPVECPAGSMLVFDSTLWHAAGLNTSGSDRLAINQQFTRSYLKQQLDYVRALGEVTVSAQPPRTQQLLGYYTRLPTSLNDYYRPPAERLYRSGQG